MLPRQILPVPFPLPLAWATLRFTANFFLPLLSVPKLNHTAPLLPLPFNMHAKPSTWCAKTRELLSHSSVRVIPPRETCLLCSSLRTPGTLRFGALQPVPHPHPTTIPSSLEHSFAFAS